MDERQEKACFVVGGVDTHKAIHVAAVVDEHDRVLDSQTFPTTTHGYKSLLVWMQSFGGVSRIGVECTGTYGAGLLRYLQRSGIEVLEVTAPDKTVRRKRGKDDTIDAENAAHAAFARIRTVTPKTRDGMIESLRVLKVCRKTAVAARRVALQMIQTQIISAPDGVRDTLRTMTRMKLIHTLAAARPDMTAYRDVATAYRIALRSLAHRYVDLCDEVSELDVMIKAIVDDLAPDLIARRSVGYESASQLLITAGDNPARLHSEAGFAALCGVSPVPASSGRTHRHRLNRGGDRAANSALHIIAVGRIHYDAATQAYVKRRTEEGHTKMEIIRCLKRYIAREVYHVISARNQAINQVQIGA